MKRISSGGFVLSLALAGCTFEVAEELPAEQEGVAQTDQGVLAVTDGIYAHHRVGLHVIRIVAEEGESPPISHERLASHVSTANWAYAPANTQFFVDRVDDVVMPNFTRQRASTLYTFASVEDQLEQLGPVAGRWAASTERASHEWLESASNAAMPWRGANFRANVFVVKPRLNSAGNPSGNAANGASRSSNYVYLRSDIQDGVNAAGVSHNMAHELGHHLNMVHPHGSGGVVKYPTPPVPGTPEYHPCNYWDLVYVDSGLDETPFFFSGRQQCEEYHRRYDLGYKSFALNGSSTKCPDSCATSGANCPDLCWFEANTSTNRLGMYIGGNRYLAGNSYGGKRVLDPLSKEVRNGPDGTIGEYAYNLMTYSPVAGWGDLRPLSESQIEIVRDTTFKFRHLSQTTCFGSTPKGNTRWTQYASDTIYVDVDTSYCGLGVDRKDKATGTPIYFASLGGDASHWLTTGVSSIYQASATKFRVYVRRANVTPEFANQNGWHVNYSGHDAKMAEIEDPRHRLESLCVGRTAVGATDWRQYGSTGIYVDVDTSRCGLSSTPAYITSLGGQKNHRDTVGATSVYSATPTGFRIFVRKSGVTPAYANSRDWHINWKAVPLNRADKGSCAGTSTTNWKAYGDNSAYIDVNTSHCAHLVPNGSTPTFFTSLMGDASHWQASGMTSIYDAGANKFRVFVSGASASFAKSNDWRIRWVMQP